MPQTPEEKEGMEEISLEMARHIGLVPSPKPYKFKGMVGPFEHVVGVSDSEYREQLKGIDDKYCSDKELFLVQAPRDKILWHIANPKVRTEEDEIIGYNRNLIIREKRKFLIMVGAFLLLLIASKLLGYLLYPSL